MKRGIALCLSVLLISVFLTGCREIGDIETANIVTAKEYAEETYNKNITDIILMEQFYTEEEKKTYGLDGAIFGTDTIPAQTKTCYRAYSPKDDLYFFIYHNTEQKYYQDNLAAGKMYIKQTNEKIRWAKRYFGKDFIGADVIWRQIGDMPDYYATTIKTIYESRDSDIKAAYNNFIKEFQNPYRYSHIYGLSGNIELRLESYVNIYVRCSLAELNQKDEELQERYHRGVFSLIFASDGIYNSHLIKTEEELITDTPE